MSGDSIFFDAEKVRRENRNKLEQNRRLRQEALSRLGRLQEHSSPPFFVSSSANDEDVQ